MKGPSYELTDPTKWMGLKPVKPADPLLLAQLHGNAQTYSDEPWVIRWTSSMAETEDRWVFCVGCGRRWEAVYQDGRVVGREFLPDDGREAARAVAAQRAKIEHTSTAPQPGAER